MPRCLHVVLALLMERYEARRDAKIRFLKTYYRWRREYGGLKIDQAKRLKELEKENVRLKKLLAEAHLDKAMLQEVASGNF